MILHEEVAHDVPWSEDDFDSIIMLATEGMGYWGKFSDPLDNTIGETFDARLAYSLWNVDGFSIDVLHNGGGVAGTLTMNGIASALPKLKSEVPDSYARLCRTMDYDAVDADILFQYAVFGSVMYG